MMIAGMDFGTTNSGMAIYDGNAVNVLPLDPAGANPRVVRTALYLTNEHAIYVGRDAVDRYFEQNIGRSAKTKKVWIGEIEVYAEDMYYVTDAYVYVDVLSPGRLFLSLKTGLRDEEYPGTVVGQYYYSLENLIAVYMSVLRARAEKAIRRPLREVVLGRPVHFALDPAHDRLAQARLLQAAFNAGFETVYLQPEPVAAAHNYATTIDRAQNVLVFDFGGGTLDITVMRLGENEGHRVLATGGIPAAGDVFDQKLVRAKLPRHFGEGSYYGPRHKALSIPKWIYDAFANWQSILELQTAESRKILREIGQTAQRRYQIEALESLVSSNYGLRMFDIVERAKRTLSSKRGAEIRLDGPSFKVREFVTRSEFEQIIAAEIQAIDRHLDDTLRDSGLQSPQIDAVIRTGGSAEIPAFVAMLQGKFGPEKVLATDTFSSVTAGLGVIGHGIASGSMEVRGYRPADMRSPAQGRGSGARVTPINLDLMQRRILVQEEGTEKVAGEKALIRLNGEQRLVAQSLPGALLEAGTPISLSATNAPLQPVVQALIASFEDRLLVVTSHYRFLLLTPGQLADMAHLEIGIGELQQLGQRESLCSVDQWQPIINRSRLLLITSQGLARPYPAHIMRESIEAPVPLMFDSPLPGVVVIVTGVDGEDTLVAVTQKGRAVRYQVDALRSSGTQILNCGKTDRVSGLAVAATAGDVLLVTADGYARRLPADWIPVPSRPNSPGKSLVARRSPLVGITVLRPGAPVWLVTNQRLVPVDASRLPIENSSKTWRLKELAPDETVQTVLRGAPAPKATDRLQPPG